MAHGYGPSIFILMKSTKTPFLYLRERHLKSDASFLQRNNYELHVRNIHVTTDTVSSLGPIKFKIHLKKSILIPSQHATFYDTYTYKTKIQ